MDRSPTVRAVIEAFLGRLDEVVDRCIEAIFEVVSTYERAGEQLRSDVRDAVRDNVGLLSRVIAQGREVARDELEVIERTGARRAEAGIPLDDVLQAYRTVSRVCWDIVAEECRRTPAEDVDSRLDAAITLAEAVLRYTDQISSAVAEAYARAQRSIVREQEGARREFLSDVLYGTDASPEDILKRAHSFGYDLSLSYVALVGVGPSLDNHNETEVASAAANAAQNAVADPIVLQKGEHTVALLPADAYADPEIVPEKLVAELGGGWRFGIGGPEPGIEGIRRAYLEAREALEIGLALGLPESNFRFDDLLLYHFLRAEPALVERFIEQMLGPLLEYDERRKGELVKTLGAYFDADGSVKAAGEALFAHPHTVTYRLKQVEKLTGWSLRDPEDKLRLQLALRAHRLGRGRRDPDD
jgi:DNA-binding PucR family transcriptional regulator